MKKVVIGSSLEALTYSYLNNLPIVYTRSCKPHFLDRFDPNQDLSCFAIENVNTHLMSPDQQMKVGIKKIFVWEKLYFNLSLAGLIPLHSKCVSLRIEGDTLKASTANARMAKIQFDDLVIFDDYSLLGAGHPEVNESKHTVYDWFSVRSGMKHEYDLLEGDGNFVSKIYFYQSERVDGNHPFKDAISYSVLSESELLDFDYSDVNARFKTLYMMKDAGIRGTRNGRDTINKNKYKYYALKLENAKRQIIPPRNVYANKDNLTFIYDPFCDIIKNNRLVDSYVSRIFQR